MPKSPLTVYALAVVFDRGCQRTVGITKLKGPESLLGRINFPGGKVEAGEKPEDAASREMLEETGIAVPADAWVPVDLILGDDFALHILTARVESVLHAKTLEAEPVWILELPFHVRNAVRQPEAYAPGFLRALLSAQNALSFEVAA